MPMTSTLPAILPILHWIATYGAPALFVLVGVAALGVGAPIPVTPLLLTLGALSGTPGGFNLAVFAVAGTAGIATGHTIDYAVGRVGHQAAHRWLAHAPLQRSGVASLVQRALALRGGLGGLTFVSRFLLTPIASPVSLVAGIAGLSGQLYLGIEVVGTSIYVVGTLWVGRALGPRLLSLGAARLIVFWILVAVITLLPVVLLRLTMALTTTAHDRHGTGPPPHASPEPTEIPDPMRSSDESMHH